MEDVSGRAIAFALDGASRFGLDPLALTADLEVEIDDLSRPNTMVAWSTLADFARRLGVAAGGPEALREIGRQASISHGFRIFETAGAVLTHPADLYFLAVRWFGPALFPMIRGRIVELDDGRLEEMLEIAPGYEDCPELFHVMHGAIEEMPRNWGHGRSNVEMTLQPGRALITIEPDARNRGRLGRFLRRLWGRRSIDTLIHELERQQEALQESFEEMREARDRIAEQALALERVDDIGRRLSEHIEIDRLAAALVEVLTDDLEFDGVSIRYELAEREATAGYDEIAPPAPARSAVSTNAGDLEGAPAAEIELRSAQGHHGSIRVWRRSGIDDRSDRASILERLGPWITIALDNALSYVDLQRHAESLAHRVRERTTRLVSANHHLVREIEERQRATDALVESEAQLRVSERLAAVGTLAAGIAHEINNPIGSILAAAQFARIAQTDGHAPEELRRTLDDIAQEAQRCGLIVKSVLQFARDERTDKWDRRLDEVLRRVVRLTQTVADESSAEVHLRMPPQPVWVHVNPIQIEQAVVNLVRNALEAGSRTVTIRLDTNAAERRALIQVADDGPGIPESDRVRIFEPFYTTRRKEGGTGLGLSVVHGIAREHAGELKIDTSDSGGATALLELPVIHPPAEPLEEKSETD